MIDPSLSQFVGLLDDTSLLAAIYDETDRLRYANPAFRKAFAIGAQEAPLWEEIMRRNKQADCGTIVKSADFDAWLISTKSRRGKQPFRSFEMDMCDGSWFMMTETVNADGWMLCIATDITQVKTGSRALRQARDSAVRASQTDELTGVSSRRAMMSALESLSAAIDSGEMASACLCIVDLDLFKKVNDTFGHQVGDQVLVAFAQQAQAVTRRRDHLGRIGGEEFMLILPDTDLSQAQLVIERLLFAVRQGRPMPMLPTMSYTCSVGIADAISGETSSALYARADQALYLAKHRGRDRLELAPARDLAQGTAAD